MTAHSGIGDAPKRWEELRCVTGRGCSLDNLVFDVLTHAVILALQPRHLLLGGHAGKAPQDGIG